MKSFSPLILLTIIISGKLNAQIIRKEIVTVGYEDCGTELFPAPDSGYYAFLYESRFVPITSFLEMVRLDKNANVLWNKYYSPPLTWGGTPVCQVSGNDFMITHFDTLIKLDTAGNIVWAIQISDTLMTGITDLYVANDASIWLGGSYNNSGLISYSLINCDTAGNILTHYNVLGDSTYYIKGISKIVETMGGDLILATYRESADSAYLDIIKITPGGQILWAYEVPPHLTLSISRDFMIEKDGGCIFTLSPNNPNSNYIYKIDSSGALVWQTALLESINGWTCYSICDSPDSGFYMTGRGRNNTTTISVGVVLCKFDDLGQLLGREQILGDTTATEGGYDIKILHGNKIAILGGLCRNGCNYQDGILIIYDQPFLTSIRNYSGHHDVLLFPNPFHDKGTLRISNSSTSELKLRIYNTTGKLMKETWMKNNASGIAEITIEREDLSSGLFFFEISESNQALTRGKMIIN